MTRALRASLLALGPGEPGSLVGVFFLLFGFLLLFGAIQECAMICTVDETALSRRMSCWAA